MNHIQIRFARDSDGDGIAALMQEAFAEYEGFFFDRAAEFPELDAIASYYAARGGVIWVAEVLTEHAEAQLYDPARIAAEMQEIADLLAAGEIDEAEAAAREEELLARLPRSGPAAGSTAGSTHSPER